jgi:ribulose-5-phosphate 4-epimerase/fuculose-1-phosphate aldolase
LAADFFAILLGSHGLVAAAPTLLDAINIVEEIEANCQIYLLAGEGAQTLSQAWCDQIDRTLGRSWPDPAKYESWFRSLA